MLAFYFLIARKHTGRRILTPQNVNTKKRRLEEEQEQRDIETLETSREEIENDSKVTSDNSEECNNNIVINDDQYCIDKEEKTSEKEMKTDICESLIMT